MSVLRVAVEAESLRRRLAALEPAVRERVMEPVLSAAAERVASRARGLVPSRTGRLRRSIRTARDGDNWYTLAGDHAAFYAAMVERGTRVAGARPYMRPAYDAERERIRMDLARALRREVG